MKYIILFTMLVSTQAWAIKYYQNNGGTIAEIDEAKFSACKTVFYRNAAKSELSVVNQKNLVKASLKGELVNDLSALVSKLKAEGGSCSYGENSESVK